MLNNFRHNKIVKMLFEAPYRVKMFFVAKKLYREDIKKITKEDMDRLVSCRDIHKGEKCFIVAMGPSLTKEDLKAVSSHICFTVNSGYRVFRECGLCPDYYVTMDDDDLTYEQMKEILKEENSLKYAFTAAHTKLRDKRLILLPTDVSPIFRLDSILNRISSRLFPFGRFSKDITKVVYSGKTVLCACMQIAAYMGFDRIYLIGADFDYTGSRVYTSMSDEDESSLKGRDAADISSVMRLQMGAVAEDARRHGIKIYNATRGGALECFERCRLEDIL